MYMNMASSSSSSAVILPQQKYDVFLSFRGQDTRQTFTSHLRAALDRKQIYTYMDDRLERGDEIGPALLTAIEQSKLSVIIFSEDYASSSWCLDEVVHILKCKEAYGQLVIPVFYDIDPSNLRKQKGTYGDAFAKHEEKFKDNMDKVRNWRDALTTTANLSGFHSQNIRPEAELVKTIVDDILAKLNQYSSTNLRGLVGIESRIQQIESLLCIQAKDVPFRIVGVWGIGGIGKTTLADVVFHRLSSKFEACSFLRNVREESEKYGTSHLRDKLVLELLKEESLTIGSLSIGSDFVRDRLSRTKVLIVLDDVNDSSQLEYLLGDQVVFGRGSRIIITSRDRRPLIERVDNDHIYQVMGLDIDDGLELFHSKASKDDSTKTVGYLDLSKSVVEYANGIPLALKALSSLFRHCNSRNDWEVELERLKKFPDKKIEDVLRASYNGLQEHEKGVFLDIACFLKGNKRSKAERMLEMHGFYKRGIEVLIDMSLISISVDNHIEMHDLLQEMGRSIVREQCTHTPGKRSRLWNAEDVYQVLKHKSGTARVEAIFLDMSNIHGLELSRTTFKHMHNLRLLKVYASNSNVDNNIVHLPEGLESFPEGLRYLNWESYPSKSLPSEFSPHNLVELHMPHGKVKKLWNNNVQNLENLRRLNLNHCKHLTEVPNLSQSRNIEKLNLSGCESLVQVPSYLKSLDKLTSLNLAKCSNLDTFPQIPCSMRFLDLSSCKQLTKVPNLSCCPNIETLDLSGCKNLVQVPSCVKNLDKLTHLNLAECSSLKTFPEIPCNMRVLDLSSCSKVAEVPNLSRCLNIEKIDLSGCKSLVQVPSCKNLDNLTHLNLAECSSLKTFPGIPCNMRVLDFSSCSKVTKVPNFSRCPNIEKIDLSGCKSLVQVPSCKNLDKLTHLNLAECSSLKTFPEIPCNMLVLDLSSCYHVTEVPDLSRCLNIEEIDLSGCESLVQVPSCKHLDKLTHLNLAQCSRLKTFPEIPCNIVDLDLSCCYQVTKFPDLSRCLNIEKLDINGTSLGEIPSYFENLVKLTSLEL